MAKSDRLSGGFIRNTGEKTGEYEASGTSLQIIDDIAISDDVSAPTRKSINLNAGTFCVPMQVHPLANMTPSERQDLVHRFKLELEQIHILQKKIDPHRINGVTLSSPSDILSCSNKHNGRQTEKFRQSSSGKKMVSSNQNLSGWKRGSSGRFETAKTISAINAHLMKQCLNFLKRLMSHGYAWVFNNPVDVVGLNIPDYFTVIKHPMDLGTIKKNLSSGVYSSPLQFRDDVRLTFTNAMTYNPRENDAHIMADTMSKIFEKWWKPIEIKLQVSESQSQPLLSNSAPCDVVEITKSMPVNKKRKVISVDFDEVPKPVNKMSEADRVKLGREIESLLDEMPLHIIEFLKAHSSKGADCADDEFEINIDILSDDTMFTLRKLLDDYLFEKQKKNQARGEACEIEMQNVSGLSNSSMPHGKEDEHPDEDVDIGENEPPATSYPPVQIEKDTDKKNSKHNESASSSDSGSSSSSDSDSDDAKSPSPGRGAKAPVPVDSTVENHAKTTDDDPLDKNQSVSGLDQLEQTPEQKPSSVESVSRQDGDSDPTEKQVSPGKLYRAAVLKGRFAETILKAREKTLPQDDKGDPEKLRKEREELEFQKKKERARLEAEAKAAEDARKLAEAQAAAEAKRKRELEREAAREASRQALLQMEKTVEINENSRFLEDLEMLRTAPAEQLESSAIEMSPDKSVDGGLGSFNFEGGVNPLEKLGLFMKTDDEEEEAELLPPKEPKPVTADEEMSPDKSVDGGLDSFNFGGVVNPLEKLGLSMKMDDEEEEAELLPPEEPKPVNENDIEDGEIEID